jgi:hypothetical protein
MDISLHDKVALVTGAGRGLGRSRWRSSIAVKQKQRSSHCTSVKSGRFVTLKLVPQLDHSGI